MTYNFYIKTQTLTYNILNIIREELDIVVDAYNKGKEDFFLDGKKYWLSKLFEIKVFTFTHPEKFKSLFKFSCLEIRLLIS